MKQIVVIGSNHAGIASINTILDNGKDCEVTVFEQNSNMSFLGCGMALWIANKVNSKENMFYTNKEALEKKGCKIYTNTPVSAIDFDKKIVYAISEKGERYSKNYDKLILATGSVPIIPKLKGSELANIQRVKLFQDAEVVIKKLENEPIKEVTVIGAGYIGIELVEAFKLRGQNVTLIDIEETCLPTYYDEKFTDMMKDNLAKNGINLKFKQKVCGFEGKDKVEYVVTDKEKIKTDMVVWAVGFRPNNELGKDKLKLFKNGAYLVNDKQQTSIPDVYAIGDCATVKFNAIKDRSYIALATNAVRAGIIAGLNCCGVDISTIGVQGSNAISIFGLNMISTGLTYKKACEAGLDVLYTDYSDLQREAFMLENEEAHIRIVYEKGSRRIVGAQLVSRYDVSMLINMFSLAIQKDVTIDELKLLDIFFLPHFDRAYNYVTMAALSAK